MPDLRSLPRVLIRGHPVPPFGGIKKLDSGRCDSKPSFRRNDFFRNRFLWADFN